MCLLGMPTPVSCQGRVREDEYRSSPAPLMSTAQVTTYLIPIANSAPSHLVLQPPCSLSFSTLSSPPSMVPSTLTKIRPVLVLGARAGFTYRITGLVGTAFDIA